MVYMGNRRFLPPDHRYRRARVAFDGNQELRAAPQRASGAEIRRCAEEREHFLASGGAEDDDEDPVRTHGVKRLSALFELPYWEVT